jgi:hypothetical protein
MRHKDFEPMQGASRQPVNAEEMLAELKRVVDASTPPSFRPSAASMVSKPGSLVRQAQIDKESDRRIQATADSAAKSGQQTVFRRTTTPIARSWKLAAGGLALAGAAMIGATFALMNRAADLPKRELAVIATEAPVRPQGGGQTVEPPSSPGPVTHDSPTEPSQVGALEARPDAMTAPARDSSLPAGGEAGVEAPPQPVSLGLESVAPAFTPAPLNPAPAPVAPQAAPPVAAPTATSPSAPASTGSALPGEPSKPHSSATAAAYAPAEAAQPSPPKTNSARKPPRKSSPQGPAKSAKASATPVAQTERRPPQPAALLNEAASPPPAAQGIGNPTPAATPAPPTIQQRFADGVTGAFSYVAHLPGALLPHPADPTADANRSGPQ